LTGTCVPHAGAVETSAWAALTATTALLRDYRAQDMAFEFVDMSLDERVKFRRLLADNLAPIPAEAEPVPAVVEVPAKR